MDWDNLALAQQDCPPHYQRKLRRLTEFCTTHEATVVPDPYYGGEEGFEHVLDLLDRPAAAAWIAGIEQSCGRPVDVLVNNAGVAVTRPFLDQTEEDWNSVIDVNLKGPVVMSGKKNLPSGPE